MTRDQQPSDRPTTPRTVLVVDDSVYWTDTLAAALRQIGFVVSCVHDGLAAMERLRSDTPDVLITDYFLPDLDGGKLCQVAKKLAKGMPISTVILTGGADRNLSRRPSVYADAVIAKNAIDVVIADLTQALQCLNDHPPSLPPGVDVIGHERLRPRAVSAKLLGLKQHLDALHEGIGDAVLAVDANRRIYFLNSMALDLLGVPEEVALGRRVELLLGIEPAHPIVQQIDEALRTGGNPKLPLTIKLKTSTLRFTVARLKNPVGEDTALCIARDISDIVAAEEERVSLTAQLNASDKMRSLGQMTAGISHELNNPLAALVPSLTIARERIGDLKSALIVSPQFIDDQRIRNALQEIPDLLADAATAAEQIKSVVASMRFFAHPAESRGERIDLDVLLKDAAALVTPEVRFRTRVEQQYEYAPNLVVERALVKQALLNILINASQAIDLQPAENNWIRIRSFRLEGGVAIDMSNSGPPIPEAIINKVFDPFFTTKQPGAGVGLGLSIAYETIARHGGTIEVVRGLPTTFRIWLPLDTGKVIQSVLPPLTAELRQTSDGTPGVRVLIVEDERLVRNGFRRVLERHFDVSMAAGGSPALEMLRQSQYDVVLCDLLMPDVTGMELYRRIEERSPEQAARFVFLTGGTGCTEAREFLQTVRNPRAFKPLDNGELVHLVERAAARLRHGASPT